MVPRNADLVSMSLRGKPFKECLALHHVSSAAEITSVYEDIPIGNTILYEGVPTVRVGDCDDSGHFSLFLVSITHPKLNHIYHFRFRSRRRSH